MKPIIANPYVVGNPIKSREMFFGREDDFQFVARKIGEGKSNQIVVLCGERRSGKTSILFQILGGRLGSSFLPILIDMQMLAGIKGDLDFFKAILKSGWASLHDAGIAEGPEKPGKHEESVERIMESFLSTVRQKAAGKIVLFLLDEYELIEAKIRDGTLSESTVHYLAGILEGEFAAAFIFTGSTNLEDRNPEIWRTLLGKSVYRKISYLSHRDTKRLIVEPLQDSVCYPEEVIESIWRLTGGQPFYTQVICQNVVDLLIDEVRADPSTQDLDRIVRELVANPLPQMIYCWNSYPAWHRIMLSSLAGTLESASAWSDVKRVVQYIWESRIVLPFNREKANVLLEEAYHKEFLEKNDTGSYRFRMDVFRRWIQREHSIWKVVKEADVGFRRALRSIIMPASISMAGVAFLVMGWFLLVPQVLPGVADWGRGIGLLPNRATNAASPETKSLYINNVSFRANRGPFTLVIDNTFSSSSAESLLGPTSLVVPSLAVGAHEFVASTLDGQSIKLSGFQLSQSSSTVFFYFPPVASTSAQGSASPESVSRAKAIAKSAQKNEGIFVVDTEPSGAIVLSGNDIKGVTPLTMSLGAGYQWFWLMREGYRSVYVGLNIQAGKLYSQTVPLEEGWAVLAFDMPEPGTVYLDGVYLIDLPAVTPQRVRSGKHLLAIENKATKGRREITLNLVAGDVFTVNKSTK